MRHVPPTFVLPVTWAAHQLLLGSSLGAADAVLTSISLALALRGYQRLGAVCLIGGAVLADVSNAGTIPANTLVALSMVGIWLAAAGQLPHSIVSRLGVTVGATLLWRLLSLTWLELAWLAGRGVQPHVLSWRQLTVAVITALACWAYPELMRRRSHDQPTLYGAAT